MSQRQIAHNNINEYSSRSHTIMALQIELEMVSIVELEGEGGGRSPVGGGMH